MRKSYGVFLLLVFCILFSSNFSCTSANTKINEAIWAIQKVTKPLPKLVLQAEKMEQVAKQLLTVIKDIGDLCPDYGKHHANRLVQYLNYRTLKETIQDAYTSKNGNVFTADLSSQFVSTTYKYKKCVGGHNVSCKIRDGQWQVEYFAMNQKLFNTNSDYCRFEGARTYCADTNNTNNFCVDWRKACVNQSSFINFNPIQCKEFEIKCKQYDTTEIEVIIPGSLVALKNPVKLALCDFQLKAHLQEQDLRLDKATKTWGNYLKTGPQIVDTMINYADDLLNTTTSQDDRNASKYNPIHIAYYVSLYNKRIHLPNDCLTINCSRQLINNSLSNLRKINKDIINANIERAKTLYNLFWLYKKNKNNQEIIASLKNLDAIKEMVTNRDLAKNEIFDEDGTLDIRFTTALKILNEDSFLNKSYTETVYKQDQYNPTITTSQIKTGSCSEQLQNVRDSWKNTFKHYKKLDKFVKDFQVKYQTE